MNLDKKQKGLVIIGIILLILFINNQQSIDKKEGNPLSAISGGIVAVVIGGILWMTGAVTGLVAGIIMLIGGASSIGGGIWDWIYPPATIPMWVWIVGFALLAFMALRKK